MKPLAKDENANVKGDSRSLAARTPWIAAAILMACPVVADEQETRGTLTSGTGFIASAGVSLLSTTAAPFAHDATSFGFTASRGPSVLNTVVPPFSHDAIGDFAFTASQGLSVLNTTAAPFADEAGDFGFTASPGVSVLNTTPAPNFAATNGTAVAGLPVSIYNGIPEPAEGLGDVNDDGVVDEQDLDAIVNHILGDPQTGTFIEERADITGDGAVNVEDVTRLANYLNGRVETLR